MPVAKSSNSFHLAGVIPVAGQPLDFNFPWHDSLQPIGQDYLAIERAVVECAYVGCETIWVVCHNDMQPLIRHRLGDYIQDPVYLYRQMSPGTIDQNRKPIPIYYVPIHPKDRDKRDCLAWSVLYGAEAAYYTSHQVSKWVVPNRYYVSFPYGIYDPEVLRQHRKTISSDQGFYLSHDGLTVKDGEYLGFTFSPEEFKKYRRDLRKKATGESAPSGKPGIPDKKLPMAERWSARFFDLEDVFGSANIGESEVVKLSWYYRADSWDGLRGFLASKDTVDKPSKDLFSYHEFNKIADSFE